MSNPTLYDAEAEYRLVLAVASEPSLFVHAAGLRVDHFRQIDAGSAWSRLTTMLQAGRPIYLSDFAEIKPATEVIPLPDFIRRDAETVRMLAQCRTDLSLASEIAKAAYQKDVSRVSDILMAAAARESYSSDTLQPISLGIDEALDRALNREKLEASLLKTGLDRLDLALGGGIELETLTMIAARPAMGKTALLVQIADAVSAEGGVVAFFQKEMSRSQIQNRLAARRARVSLQHWRSGDLDREAEARLADELIALSGRDRLYLDCSTPQSTQDVFALCQALQQRLGRLDLVIGDHVRLFSDQADTENHRLGKIAWNYKMLSKQLKTRSLLAVQINRAVESQVNKQPDLKDLRDSGELEENADNVIVIHRPSYYDGSADLTAELIVRKARDGERNFVARQAFTKWMSFEPLAGLEVLR